MLMQTRQDLKSGEGGLRHGGLRRETGKEPMIYTEKSWGSRRSQLVLMGMSFSHDRRVVTTQRAIRMRTALLRSQYASFIDKTQVWSFGLLTILDAAFQCRSHPHYPSVGNNTRRLVIQLNIPDHAETLFSYGIEFRYVSASCLNIDVAFSSETERRLENDLNVACRFPS